MLTKAAFIIKDYVKMYYCEILQFKITAFNFNI